jgi:hypothetical protein
LVGTPFAGATTVVCERSQRAASSLGLGAARGVERALRVHEVGLGLLEVELVARAFRDELPVLGHALLREIHLRRRLLRARRGRVDGGLRRRHLGHRPGELFLQLAVRALGVRELSLERVHLQLVGRRVEPEEHVALPHLLVALGRDLDHAPAHLRHDVHDVLEHPYVRG